MSAHYGTGRTVGQVAALAGVTVRTLHHFESIGLLVPSARTLAGYRQYTDSDIDRLTRILFYRELGIPLNDITSLLADGQPAVHLAHQRTLIRDRIARDQRLLAALERELEAQDMQHTLTPEEKLQVFGEFDPDVHEAEARERWGDTDAWKESNRRTRHYSKEDWLTIRAETDDLTARQLAAMQSGVEPTSEVAMDLAEEHRQQITRRFYTCSPDMHRSLADLFESDSRYTNNMDAAGVGLAAWLGAAIRANATRQEASGLSF